MRWTSVGVLCSLIAVTACSSDDGSSNGSGGAGSGGSGGSGNSATGGNGGSGTGAVGGSSGGAAGESGSGGSAGSSTGAAGGSGGSGGASCTFSDDFAGASLDPCWSILNGSSSSPLIDIMQSSGALHLQAIQTQNGVWYQGSTKSLVFQTLTGDFKVTTTAHPRKRSNGNEAPSLALHVGGLMARNPSSSGGNTENYLFAMVGSNEQSQPGVEIKSTTNGTSIFSEPVWSDPLGAELRICRLGASFYVYKRAPGSSTWILADHQGQAAAISRPDLPATLQVGMALNFSGPPNDLDVAFDEITLASPAPQSVADCTSD